ncbi:MAG: hypothetical protein ACKO96_02860 [Flammeovirgaceae bacterium]
MKIAVVGATTTITVIAKSHYKAAAAIVNKCCVTQVATTITVVYLRISTSKRKADEVSPPVIAGNMDELAILKKY